MTNKCNKTGEVMEKKLNKIPQCETVCQSFMINLNAMDETYYMEMFNVLAMMKTSRDYVKREIEQKLQDIAEEEDLVLVIQSHDELILYIDDVEDSFIQYRSLYGRSIEEMEYFVRYQSGEPMLKTIQVLEEMKQLMQYSVLGYKKDLEQCIIRVEDELNVAVDTVMDPL